MQSCDQGEGMSQNIPDQKELVKPLSGGGPGLFGEQR